MRFARPRQDSSASRNPGGGLPALTAGVVLALAAGGCAEGNRSTSLEVPAGEYATAFDAARQVLRDYRFDLDRVDARAGVITTASKESAGLATPWDAEQTTLGQEVEDLLAEQRRRVRVTFEPRDTGGTGSSGDLLDAGGRVLDAKVEVFVERVYVRGVKPSPRAILLSRQWYDPVSISRGQSPRYEAPLSRDEGLARRLSAEIRRRLERAKPQG